MARSRLLLLLPFLAFGCAAAADADDEDDATTSEDPLAKSPKAEWFYDGPLPTLEDPVVTVSLDGHTARVSGVVPRGASLSTVPPHVKLSRIGARTRLDAVYPIATARAGKTNSPPGSYRMGDVIPFRPDGTAVTEEEGVHFVTWGGFPFLRYNGGIALHGPITYGDNKGDPDVDVWYLQRGDVSGGCNRMMGEHVVEVAHVVGVNMRRAYAANQQVDPRQDVKVVVISGYDRYAGKWVDVDYPTDARVSPPTAVRPSKVYGADKVVMFGSWVASTMPNGRDLPPDFQWEGGVSGQPYVFREHAKKTWVCSVGPDNLPRLRAWTNKHGSLPQGFCKKKGCFLKALAGGDDPKAACAL